jgi:muramoyltetrapeptide carboxypeptidase
MLIKPGRLRIGDTVAIVAPASAPPEPDSIDRSVEAIETLGFKPRLAPNVRKRKGFLAGTDRERAADLLQMFAAPEVRAILCLRGGYGTSRLIPLLDFTMLRRNPKIFMGYSDITSLHCALLTQANLISFHGPMLNSDFIRKDFPDFTLRGFLRTLTEARPAGSIRQGYPD